MKNASFYNAAKAYSIQLDKGNAYSSLSPVIVLTITDFVMFPEREQMRSHFRLKEKDLLFDYPSHDLELVFVELPKFNRALDDLVNLTDKWAYFLAHARELETIPETLRTVAAIEQAFEVANQANLSHEELEDLEHQEMFIQDQRGAVRKALKQGAEQAQRAIALRLRPMMDDWAIADTTGLSLELIQELRQESETDTL